MEEIQDLSDAFASKRLSPDNFPSNTEWLLTVEITGICLLLFGVGERLPPQEQAHETEGVPGAATA